MFNALLRKDREFSLPPTFVLPDKNAGLDRVLDVEKAEITLPREAVNKPVWTIRLNFIFYLTSSRVTCMPIDYYVC